MYLERVLNFCIKTWNGSCTIVLLIYIFYEDWAYILNFNEECFDKICIISFCESISKLKDGI